MKNQICAEGRRRRRKGHDRYGRRLAAAARRQVLARRSTRRKGRTVISIMLMKRSSIRPAAKYAPHRCRIAEFDKPPLFGAKGFLLYFSQLKSSVFKKTYPAGALMSRWLLMMDAHLVIRPNRWVLANEPFCVKPQNKGSFVNRDERGGSNKMLNFKFRWK